MSNNKGTNHDYILGSNIILGLSSYSGKINDVYILLEIISIGITHNVTRPI